MKFRNEASGTLRYTRMVIVPEDWMRPSVSSARLVELARSERGEFFPPSNYCSDQSVIAHFQAQGPAKIDPCMTRL